jgi:hypothetical protein
MVKDLGGAGARTPGTGVLASLLYRRGPTQLRSCVSGRSRVRVALHNRPRSAGVPVPRALRVERNSARRSDNVWNGPGGARRHPHGRERRRRDRRMGRPTVIHKLWKTPPPAVDNASPTGILPAGPPRGRTTASTRATWSTPGAPNAHWRAVAARDGSGVRCPTRNDRPACRGRHVRSNVCAPIRTGGGPWPRCPVRPHPSPAPRGGGKPDPGGGNGDAGPEKCSGPASGRPSAARQRVAWYSSTIS